MWLAGQLTLTRRPLQTSGSTMVLVGLFGWLVLANCKLDSAEVTIADVYLNIESRYFPIQRSGSTVG